MFSGVSDVIDTTGRGKFSKGVGIYLIASATGAP
jgi:hypothetical protein